MKTSYYNIYFTHKESAYVYNTLSTAILCISPDLSLNLKENKLDSIDEDVKKALQGNNIIVGQDVDECAAYEYYYNSIQYGKTEDEFRIVVLPTYKCNLKCVYCFEGNKDIDYKLDSDKVAALLKFAKNEVNKNPQYRKFKLVLFGGEPLLYKEKCILLVQEFKNMSDSLNLVFSTQIITNSILLDSDTIERLIIPFKMKIQITVDGVKESHDKRRIYKSGAGTYDKILESIHLLNQHGCKELIDLRLNIDRENLNDVKPVFEYFTPLCGYIYIGLLKAIGNNSCQTDSCISDAEYLSEIRPQFIDIINSSNNRNKEYVSFGKKRPCALNRKNSYIVDSALNVYKCDNMVGDKRYIVGKIEDGLLMKHPNYYKLFSWSPFHFLECRACKLLPACGAACAYQCIINKGSMDKPYCTVNEESLVKQICIYLDNNG